MNEDARCGTYAGANAHTAKKEPLCQDCKDAKASYVRMWRFRTGRHRDLMRCPKCGSVFPTHRCEGQTTL